MTTLPPNDKQWLQSNPDMEIKTNCDHCPIQSSLYANNEKLIDQILTIMYILLMMLFMGLIFLTSWKNIEKGKFPFNIDFMADMAYSKHKMGTPMMALFITFLAAVLFLFTRRLFLKVTEDKVYDKLMEKLKSLGKIRIIKPQNPNHNY